MFSSNGEREIESIKMFPVDKAEKAYAFVCFKTPDQAQAALSQLNGQNINKRQLQICHYELKEFRDIADEETKDKFGFQRFKELNYQQRQWNDITSKDEFQYKLIELLKNLPQQAGRPFNQMNGPMRGNQHMGGQRNYQNRQNSAGRPGQRQNMPYQARGNSMENRHNQGGMMGGQIPMPSNQMNIAPQHQGQNPQISQAEQMFYQNTMKLVPSIVPANPHMKQQVGNAIFDFVTKLKGNQFAPKITGMLIDLPHEEIKVFMQNYSEFVKKVNDAGNLLQVQSQQQPGPAAPMMQAPMQAPGQTPQPPQM